MFKKIISVIMSGVLCLALVSCNDDTKSSLGADKYKFETKEWVADTFIVKVVAHKSFKEMLDAFEETSPGKTFPDGRSLAAFSIITSEDGVKTCTIHIIDPAVSYQPEFIGHELTHCQYGRFHPNQD